MPCRILYRPEGKRAGPRQRRIRAKEESSLARKLLLKKDLDHRILKKNSGFHRLGLGWRRLRGYGTGADFISVWF